MTGGDQVVKDKRNVLHLSLISFPAQSESWLECKASTSGSLGSLALQVFLLSSSASPTQILVVDCLYHAVYDLSFMDGDVCFAIILERPDKLLRPSVLQASHLTFGRSLQWILVRDIEGFNRWKYPRGLTRFGKIAKAESGWVSQAKLTEPKTGSLLLT